MSQRVLNPLKGAKPLLLLAEDANVLGELVNQLIRIARLKNADGTQLTVEQQLALVSHHQGEALGALTKRGVESIAAATAPDVAISALHHASTTSKAAVTVKIRVSEVVSLGDGTLIKKFVRDFLKEIAGLQQVAREALELYGQEASA